MSDFRILLSLAGKADSLCGESNWSAWKRDLPMVLEADGASWDIIEGTTPLPPVTDADARSLYNLRNKQARTVIWSMINQELHPIILDKATGKDTYAALKAKFESTSLARRVALRTALHRVVHDPSKRIDVYIESLKDLRRQLKDMGTEVGDDYFKDILLTNLDHSFAHVHTSLLSQPSGDMIGCRQMMYIPEFKARSFPKNHHHPFTPSAVQPIPTGRPSPNFI
ncbi:hypothetical protein K435DRAFT_853921 [Dendrothele bispora CBS 962.96]|uniref:Uncharacterized protein n=1 Tax=Dendrothele bispora (strain CBS 962.96) TaxID=1314807 RepID=A0A4S8MFG7_DENBC|nr:hypothetical protein K435DRAFT_853921 [Dendrothele bispora CBS 962.96]